jgi:hypothetical protein
MPIVSFIFLYFSAARNPTSFQQNQSNSDEVTSGNEGSGSGDDRGPALDEDIATHEWLSSDPEDHLHAKKILKKAILEHYRYVSHFSFFTLSRLYLPLFDFRVWFHYFQYSDCSGSCNAYFPVLNSELEALHNFRICDV